MFDYIRDPKEIYRRSFEIIRAEADLTGIPEAMAAVAIRVAHASGTPDITRDFAYSPGAAEAGRQALVGGSVILVDTEMLNAGIIRDRLPAANQVVCTVHDPEIPEKAAAAGTTRSAVAVEMWKPRLGGAVVAIGNAPTALFRLLEGLAAGWPRPALIVGMPVGFVGAAEAKDALIEADAAPFIALTGRRGGSAVAAATVNALAIETGSAR